MKKPKPEPFMIFPVIQPASAPITIQAMSPCPIVSISFGFFDAE
jgi:hypothetical protein